MRLQNFQKLGKLKTLANLVCGKYNLKHRGKNWTSNTKSKLSKKTISLWALPSPISKFQVLSWFYLTLYWRLLPSSRRGKTRWCGHSSVSSSELGTL